MITRIDPMIQTKVFIITFICSELKEALIFSVWYVKKGIKDFGM